MTILAVKKMQKNAGKIQPNHTILLKNQSLLIQSANIILISGMQGFASKDDTVFLHLQAQALKQAQLSTVAQFLVSVAQLRP